MRTDYKIGIAVVLLVLGVIVVYNAFVSPPQAPVETSMPAAAAAAGVDAEAVLA